jgi:N4-gp56 family major capsid protein
MPITSADVVDLRLQQLSKDVRLAAQNRQVFRQFVRPEGDFGAHMGDEVKFITVGNIAEEGREVSEDGDIPQGTLPIRAKLATVREYRLEIPWNDRASLLSQLSLESMIIRQLTNNGIQKLDKLSAVPFRTCEFVYTPTGPIGNKNFTLGTAGVALAVASRPVSAYDLKNIRGLMKSTYNIPGFAGSSQYVGIVTESTSRSLSDDPEYVDIMKRYKPAQLLNGEMTEYYNFRILEENNCLNNNLPNGCGECVFFGDDPVVELELYPFELQRALAESYGRTKAICWVWYGGFARTWNFATDGEIRMMRVGSLPA